MPDPYRRSPLRHRQEISSRDGARMAEEPFMGKLVLRGKASLIGEQVKGVLGLSLPTEPCTANMAEEAAALWIGPDEWWMVMEEGGEPSIASRLGEALSGRHHQLVDVTDYYTTIELEGPRAPEIMMKLTTLDLHSRTFPPGSVAGSMFGQTQATLWHVGLEEPAGSVFRLFVRLSMADYLWCLLAEGGREFGLPPQPPLQGEIWRLQR